MEKLWKIVEKEKIIVLYKNLRVTRPSLCGLYLLDEIAESIILLDTSIKYIGRMEKCVLAEEIGHYYTAPRNNYLVPYPSYTVQNEMSQDERRALRWATNFLIPNKEFYKALKDGCRGCYELAEYFDVTEWLMYRKLELLKACSHKECLKVGGENLFECETQLCSLV